MCLLYNAKLMGSVSQSNLHVRSPLVTVTASTFWEASCRRPRTYLRGLIIMYCIFCATQSIRRIFLVITQSLTNRTLEISCSKFSFKNHTCCDLYSEKTPVVRSFSATTSRKRPLNLSFTFCWPLTGRSTVFLSEILRLLLKIRRHYSHLTLLFDGIKVLFLTNTTPVP